MGQQVANALRDSMHRVLVKLVSFLPGLLALLVAVLILTAIGWGLAVLIRRVLFAARFDERFARNQNTTVADWSPNHSPSDLVARIVFWACVILGVIIGISAFDASYPGNFDVSVIVIPYLTHSVGAILILLVGTLIARFLQRSVLIGAVNLQLQYARFLALGVKWLVLVLTAAMVLEHLEIGGNIVSLAFGILFGGIVLTLSLAVGLGSRDLVSRSLEKSSESARGAADEFEEVVPHTQTAPKPAETLRHF